MKTLLSLFVVTIPFLSISQEKGKRAVIIKSTNDTIVGFVDDKEWLTNPSIIKIKESESGSFKQYTPAEIKSIRISDGDYYESHLIKIDNTPLEFEGPFFDSSLIAKVEKHVFLLVQFSNADLKLYSYRFNNQKRFYLQKGNEIPQELIYRKYTVKRANGVFEMEDKTYAVQLGFLAENCGAVAKKLAVLSYRLPEIIDLLNTYNKQCGKTTNSYVHSESGKAKLSVSVIAGVSKTDLSFEGPNPDAVYVGVITRTPLKTKISFAAGIRINYGIPRAHQKLLLFSDIYYNQFTASTLEYTYNTAPDNYETKMLTINAKYLHASLGLKYFLNKEKPLRPFLQAGISESFMLSDKSEAVWNKHNSGTNTVTKEYPFPNSSLKKSAFGGFVGGGLAYEKFGIDFRYHAMGSFTRFSSIGSSINAVTLFLSFQLTR